ncbi:MAG: NAD(P)H-hydrate dehydratase [Prevotella sp.]|nr:NAD(P)H-hydrate dehydratase [Bacteroides sp.]MCM1365706.1 NAD(P)H-hydrate dehydratase [Prevotella sp.]MCM1436376.1 NAD(P)H-hydrate dehydratase [Prevotella sp.]
MKIFNSNTIREIDRATCVAQGIDSVELMERAAEAVTVEIMSRFLPGRRIVVVAGPGNNGGDALAVSRRLMEQGYKHVEVFLFNVTGKLSHDCKVEKERLLELDTVDFTEVTREFTPPILGKGDVVIDGLFGSGLNRPLEGGFVALARYINESDAYIISIDMPSGLFGEWNNETHIRDMVHANLTLAFQLPRLSFFFEENAEAVGDCKLIDIDLDKEIIKKTPSEFMLIEKRSVKPLLKPRQPYSAKRDYGSALLFAGSMGMMGAAVLCTRGVLRSGAGLATVHSAKCGIEIVQTAVPEAMFEPDRNDRYITDMSVHHAHQVVACGPGLGTHDSTVDALESLLKHCQSPLVLDADALNCIVKRPALLRLLPTKTVITPHIGEFDRLFGEQRSGEERLRKAVEVAKYYNIVVVLKGHHTAIVRPTGTVYFNGTGNPGMATAGSGDVLTGVIASFVAQGYLPEHAATLGVFIHGLAGDLAAAEVGEDGVTAGDIANKLGLALAEARG